MTVSLPGFYQVFFGAVGASPTRLIVAIGLSLLLGAGHAVSPGHGKTLVVASLLGSRGSLGRAMLLAASVAVTHTAGVLLLAAVVLGLNDTLLPERLTPYLTLAASLLVVGLGVDLTRRAVNARRRAADDGHGRSPHDHAHPHVHGPGGDRDDLADLHAPEHASPVLGRGYTVLVGVVGGFVPNATALVVLSMAITLDQLELGLLLVVMFGVGMALVLSGVGLAAVFVRRRGGDLQVRGSVLGRALALLPVASGIAVLAVGLFLTSQSLGGLGLA